MEIKQLQERIIVNQKWLLDISKKINTIITSNSSGVDNIMSWLTYILAHEKEVLKSFQIQADTDICNAVLKLLSAESSYRDPLLKMLIYRILICTHSTIDLKNYLVNNPISQIVENLTPLLSLTDEYITEYLESLAIEKVCESLEDSGLKEYIVHFKETDIQIVLKTIKADNNRQNKLNHFNKLLDFLFSRLLANKKKRGAISASRHAWWALKDLIKYRDSEWLKVHKIELIAILENIIDNKIYFDRKNIVVNDITETSSTYYERVWVLENAIQLLEITTNTLDIFPKKTTSRLREFVQVNLDEHLNASGRSNNLRNVQCDLVLLYFVLGHYDLIFSVEHAVSVDDNEDDELTVQDVYNKINE